jgi:hypothetical protein
MLDVPFFAGKEKSYCILSVCTDDRFLLPARICCKHEA